MKYIIIALLTTLLSSTATAEPIFLPRNESQRMVLLTDNQSKVVIKRKPELLLFDHEAPKSAEKLIAINPSARRMITWR